MTQLTGYVYATYDYDWNTSPLIKHWFPDLWAHKVPNTETRILLHEAQIEVELPPDFNPVPKQVAALEAEKTAALAEYQKKVAEVNERLSKLLCITNEVTE